MVFQWTYMCMYEHSHLYSALQEPHKGAKRSKHSSLQLEFLSFL